MIWQRARHRAIEVQGQKRCAAARAQSRLSLIGIFFIALYVVIFLRMADLTIVKSERLILPLEEVEVHHKINPIIARRGDIYDRNGFLLATTLKTTSLFVDPLLVLEPEKLLAQVRHAVPGIDKNEAREAILANNRFGWLAHNISPGQQQAILEIGDPGLGFQEKFTRIYPQGPLFAHMVGYTDTDGLGLAGIERSFDDVLSAGQDVILTLDLRLQHLVKRETLAAINDFQAKAGVGLIMDAKTGELLAGVSLPDFDLNHSAIANDNQKFNRLTLGVYELGSMFKIFSTAAAIEFKNIDMTDTFDAREPIKVGWHTIRDYHAKRRVLTLPEAFMYSSNISSAIMGEMVGAQGLKNFYSDLGLMGRMPFSIKEVGTPILPDPWRPSTTMTVSYGHGIATSPLQMSSAVATIINGGYGVHPYMVKSYGQNGEGREPEIQSGLQAGSGEVRVTNNLEKIRIISSETSEKMRKLLRLSVTKGTGKNADVEGLRIGGKTGTAEKSVNGRYDSKKLISSFVAAFPMNDPRYIVMVMIDEPKGHERSYGYATAGWVAAPAVKRIAISMAAILSLPLDKEADGIDEPLWQHVKEIREAEEKVKAKMRTQQGGKKLVSY